MLVWLFQQTVVVTVWRRRGPPQSGHHKTLGIRGRYTGGLILHTGKAVCYCINEKEEVMEIVR